MNRQRKADHIRISLEEEVTFDKVTAGFEQYQFTHCALPELDLQEIDTSSSFLHKSLNAPLLISSMTGGTGKAERINRHLAQAAQEAKISMGLGSIRAALEDASLVPTFQIREVAPDILLLTNLGAVQLNYGVTVDDCQRAIDMVEADGLILHLNPLQEALQPEGQTNFANLLAKIEAVCQALPVPVIVKEVGFGLSAAIAHQLVNAGVTALDVAGAGGTSWSQVEMFRAENNLQREIATAFRDWGIPTADAIQQIHHALPNIPLIASGGIENGIQVAKAIALGATTCGIARSFLAPAIQSAQAVLQAIDIVITQLRVTMFSAGVQNIPALAHTPLQAA